MLLLILPGLLLTWALVSIFDSNPDDDPTDDEAGTDKSTVLTDGDDDFIGNAANDTVDALDGDDDVFGNRGADTLFLGQGDDAGYGGAGTDTVYGGSGNDFLDGGTNDDKLIGGDGNDYTYLPGTDGTPAIIGEEGGNDLIRGGDGDDVLFDGKGRNEIYGGSGNDAIDGREIDTADSPDDLYGGSGNDGIVGDDGDRMTGGNGVDSFGVTYFAGNDPVRILDFDKDDGEIVLIDYRGADVPVINLTETSGDTIVSVNGNTIAILKDVIGVDPDSIALLDA